MKVTEENSLFIFDRTYLAKVLLKCDDFTTRHSGSSDLSSRCQEERPSQESVPTTQPTSERYNRPRKGSDSDFRGFAEKSRNLKAHNLRANASNLAPKKSLRQRTLVAALNLRKSRDTQLGLKQKSAHAQRWNCNLIAKSEITQICKSF